MMCFFDPSGKGEHCYCIEIDISRGVKACCRCKQWNIGGNNWTRDSDYR